MRFGIFLDPSTYLLNNTFCWQSLYICCEREKVREGGRERERERNKGEEEGEKWREREK